MAWIVLNDFLKVVDWAQIHLNPPDPDVSDELEILVEYAEDNRADALGEVLAQSQEFLTFFAGLMGIEPGSHKFTRALLHVGELVGIASAMHFKFTFKRPRPSTYCPALFPPISVPAHPSYPSGHATQSNLIAGIMKLVRAGDQPLGYGLDTLARRIGLNREYAGLHFPSDTQAGIALATQILPVVQSCQSFQELLEWATGEWE